MRDVDYASKLGYVIKLIGMSKVEDDGVSVMVAPMMIKKGHPLASVESVNNAIMVKGNAIGNAMFYGPGAGKLPTASAVVADVIDVAKNPGRENRVLWTKSENEVIRPQDKAEFKYFVRVASCEECAKEEISKIFGNCEFLDVYEDELGFVTEIISESQLEDKISSLTHKVIHFTRIMPDLGKR